MAMCLQTSDHEIWCSRGSELTPSLTFQIKGQTSNKNMIHITHTHSNIPAQGAQPAWIYLYQILLSWGKYDRVYSWMISETFIGLKQIKYKMSMTLTSTLMQWWQGIVAETMTPAVWEGEGSCDWTRHSIPIDSEHCLERLIHTDAPAEFMIVSWMIIQHTSAFFVLENISMLLMNAKASVAVPCNVIEALTDSIIISGTELHRYTPALGLLWYQAGVWIEMWWDEM